MLDILLKISDLILPPPPAILLLRSENSKSFSKLFSPLPLPQVIALSRFQNPKIHAAITANKFHNHKKAARLLAVLFDTWLLTLPEKPTYLVPIPLGPKRQKERGYNQVERVLSYSTNPHIRLVQLLEKPLDTKPQTALSREERLANIKHVFTLGEKPNLVASARVIICDDVVTTGATLNEARATLAPHLAKDCELICLALAH